MSGKSPCRSSGKEKKRGGSDDPRPEGIERGRRDKRDKGVKTFTETISGIRKFSEQADKTLDAMIRADEHWFLGSLVKLFAGKRG